MKRVLILFNIQAGHGKAEQSVAEIERIFNDGGYQTTAQRIIFSENPFDNGSDYDLVAICGGDGTINFVVNAMADKSLNLPIGIIPMGTANDFAGAIGMSSKPLKAARQIVSGTIELLDCGRVNDRLFVNIFSFGLFTTTSQHTADSIKHKIGKMAYIFEGVKELRTFRYIPLHINYGSEHIDCQCCMALIFNGETAGRFRLARKASVRDGELDLLLLDHHNVFATAWAMLIFLINGRDNFAIRHIRTPHLELSSPLTPHTDVDGQSGPNLPANVVCLHEAIRVVCPHK